MSFCQGDAPPPRAFRPDPHDGTPVRPLETRDRRLGLPISNSQSLHFVTPTCIFLEMHPDQATDAAMTAVTAHDLFVASSSIALPMKSRLMFSSLVHLPTPT